MYPAITTGGLGERLSTFALREDVRRTGGLEEGDNPDRDLAAIWSHLDDNSIRLCAVGFDDFATDFIASLRMLRDAGFVNHTDASFTGYRVQGGNSIDTANRRTSFERVATQRGVRHVLEINETNSGIDIRFAVRPISNGEKELFTGKMVIDPDGVRLVKDRASA